MAPVPRPDRARQHREAAHGSLAAPGELGEELLARAVAAALVQGASWALIGARLGVPDPCAARSGCTCSDLQWQDAIVDHENARAHRIHDPLPGPGPTAP